MNMLLPEIAIAEFAGRERRPLDPQALSTAAQIIADVKIGGEAALLEHSRRFGDIATEQELYADRAQLKKAFDTLPEAERKLLSRTADRITTFAKAQRKTITELSLKIRGGSAGQRVFPLERAACYAPGGRYPLPSSVLMTCCVARAAGVTDVVAASPKPTLHTLAAAYIGGADLLLCAGGAQAIAALAYGAGRIKPADIIVGPGNRWVTAAKYLVSVDVAIDILAGPSELVVIAEPGSDASLIAADLIAQAEHDDALPILVSLDQGLIEQVREACSRQLEDLPSAETARIGLERGAACYAPSADDAVRLVNALAPEHLELFVTEQQYWLQGITNYGALFIGSRTAEVAGDYGAGPNHVLPTGGTARVKGGLSVFNFLRIATWLELDESADADEVLTDAVTLARLEGLEGHARSAARRVRKTR